MEAITISNVTRSYYIVSSKALGALRFWGDQIATSHVFVPSSNGLQPNSDGIKWLLVASLFLVAMASNLIAMAST